MAEDQAILDRYANLGLFVWVRLAGMRLFEHSDQGWFLVAVIAVIIVARMLTIGPDFNFKRPYAIIRFLGAILFVFSFGILYLIFSR
jgi:hypothetical protein